MSAESAKRSRVLLKWVAGILAAVIASVGGYLIKEWVTPDENHPPVAVTDLVQVTEDGSVEFDVLANDRDADGDSLSVVIVESPDRGTAEALAQGLVRYTPLRDYAGPDSFMYKADDGGAVSDDAEVSITVVAKSPPDIDRLTYRDLVTDETGSKVSFDVVYRYDGSSGNANLSLIAVEQGEDKSIPFCTSPAVRMVNTGEGSAMVQLQMPAPGTLADTYYCDVVRAVMTPAAGGDACYYEDFMLGTVIALEGPISIALEPGVLFVPLLDRSLIRPVFSVEIEDSSGTP